MQGEHPPSGTRPSRPSPEGGAFAAPVRQTPPRLARRCCNRPQAAVIALDLVGLVNNVQAAPSCISIVGCDLLRQRLTGLAHHDMSRSRRDLILRRRLVSEGDQLTGIPGLQDPEPDTDRGPIAVVARLALRWPQQARAHVIVPRPATVLGKTRLHDCLRRRRQPSQHVSDALSRSGERVRAANGPCVSVKSGQPRPVQVPHAYIAPGVRAHTTARPRDADHR